MTFASSFPFPLFPLCIPLILLTHPPSLPLHSPHTHLPLSHSPHTPSSFLLLHSPHILIFTHSFLSQPHPPSPAPSSSSPILSPLPSTSRSSPHNIHLPHSLSLPHHLYIPLTSFTFPSHTSHVLVLPFYLSQYSLSPLSSL